MPKVCPSCSVQNPDSAKFCNECGTKFNDSERVNLTPQPATRASERRPASERRVISVLFADIKDYTALSEQLDPEQVEELVGGLFREFADVVARHGGYVDKFMGDSVLALFGAPKSLGDDAERAVNCALEMQRRAQASNAGREKQLGVRIGIDTGEVVVGNIGQRGQYTAIGDAVNTANRVQSAAEPTTVYISEETARVVKARFRLSEQEPRLLKGKAEPVTLFRVEGALKTTERYNGPFVGRKRELDLLLASYEQAVANAKPRFVLVRGEAGMGKSRLFYEFRRRLRAQKQAPRRLTAAFVPVGQEPMLGMRQIARGALDLAPNAPVAEIDAAIARVTESISDAPKAFAEHLAFLVGRPSRDTDMILPPRQRAEGAAVALKRMLEQSARVQPLLVVYEDLHWADSDSLDFLRRIAHADLQGPIFILAFGRPEAIDLVRDLLANPFESIELRALEPGEIAAVSGGILQDGVISEDLAALVLQRSGGNPFVTEELLKSLRETHMLELRDGRYVLRDAQSQSLIPVGVRSILAARIDALEPESRAALTSLSVLGREFRSGPALHLCGAPAIEALVKRGMLVDLGSGDTAVLKPEERRERRYLFSHALLQEVAYGGLLRRDRCALHAGVAAYFEKQGQGSDPARLSELAWHYSRAERPDAAWPLFYRAGLKAAQDWLLAFAAAQLRSAKEEFDRCKTPPGIDGLSPEGSRLKLLLALCEACFDSGKPDEALKYAEEAIALTPDGFARQRASAFEFAARIAQIKSRFDDAIVHAERACALHEKAGDSAGVARMNLFKARMLAHTGQSAAGLALIEQLSLQDAGVETRIDFHHTRASLLSALGRLKEALDDETKRLALATEANDRRKIAGAHSNIATYLSDMGRNIESDEHFKLAMAEYTRAGELFNVAIVHGNYGNQLRRARRLDEAVQHHTLARGLCRELGDEFGIMVAENNLGTCYLTTGDFAEARLSFERALPLAERFGSAQAMSQLFHNQATVALRCGDSLLCRERLERSREINARQGNERGLLLNDNLAAQDLVRAGNLDQASRELASVAERAAKQGFASYEGSAYLHMLEAARQRSSAPEMRRLLDVLERCQPEQNGGSDEKALRQAHRLAAACFEGEPEGLAREVQRFAQCAPTQVATAQDAEALAIAVSSLGARAAQWPQGAAWSDLAVRAMEKGGRQDLLFVEALFARGRFRLAAGDEGGANDLVRAGRFAARLGLGWLMERLQKS
jgi:class 3 adenylate cyclase/tetratricopeptide (TPR) repeat protein